MVCPQCRNKGFSPTDDLSKPIKNIGGKECFDGFDIRRYVCLQCGYAWKTVEKFHAVIKVRKQLDLFAENAA